MASCSDHLCVFMVIVVIGCGTFEHSSAAIGTTPLTVPTLNQGRESDPGANPHGTGVTPPTTPRFTGGVAPGAGDADMPPGGFPMPNPGDETAHEANVTLPPDVVLRNLLCENNQTNDPTRPGMNPGSAACNESEACHYQQSFSRLGTNFDDLIVIATIEEQIHPNFRNASLTLIETLLKSSIESQELKKLKAVYESVLEIGDNITSADIEQLQSALTPSEKIEVDHLICEHRDVYVPAYLTYVQTIQCDGLSLRDPARMRQFMESTMRMKCLAFQSQFGIPIPGHPNSTATAREGFPLITWTQDIADAVFFALVQLRQLYPNNEAIIKYSRVLMDLQLHQTYTYTTFRELRQDDVTELLRLLCINKETIFKPYLIELNFILENNTDEFMENVCKTYLSTGPPSSTTSHPWPISTVAGERDSSTTAKIVDHSTTVEQPELSSTSNPQTLTPGGTGYNTRGTWICVLIGVVLSFA